MGNSAVKVNLASQRQIDLNIYLMTVLSNRFLFQPSLQVTDFG